jgi:hypothetical protein
LLLPGAIAAVDNRSFTTLRPRLVEPFGKSRQRIGGPVIAHCFAPSQQHTCLDRRRPERRAR